MLDRGCLCLAAPSLSHVFSSVTGRKSGARRGGMPQGGLLRALLLAAAVLSVGSPFAYAANTYTVNALGDSGAGSGTSGDIRYVIEQADMAANAGSTIVFDSTVFPASATTTISLSHGELAISESMTITGPGANVVTISGGGNGSGSRVFDIASSSATVTLSGLTITGGNGSVAYSSTSGNEAGAIFNGGTLTLSGCTLSGNSATGISGGPNGSGGAIFNAGTLTVTGSTIGNNSANSASSTLGVGEGGAIFNAGTLTVTNTTFSGNSATTTGGAIENSTDGALTVTDTTFSGNRADVGGAVTNEGYSTSVTISLSTFAGNTASGAGGGAINNEPNGGPMTVINSTISGNSAAIGDGGGIWNESSLTAENDIFSGNSANAGGGIWTNVSLSGGYNVLGGDSGGDCTGSGCFTNGVSNNQVGVAAASIDLLPLGNYGGPTETMLPGPASAAICAGLLGDVPQGVTTDQRGFVLYPSECGGSEVDAGADQTNYRTVTTLADSTNNSSTCTGGENCSLRDAIGLANASGGDIDFLSSLTSTSSPGTITLGANTGTGDIALPAIAEQVNIIGPGANQLTVSGNNDGSVGSVFTVNSGAQAILYGLTVTGGYTLGEGGGFLNEGTLTIVESAIEGNSAPYENGAGIANFGTLTVMDSTIANNVAYGSGGGIDQENTGPIPTASVVDSTIYGNTSGNGGSGGGGIRDLVGTMTVTGSTISGNSAANEGGGIYNEATLAVNNSIVAGNTAASYANIGNDATYNAGTGNVIGGSSNSNTSMVNGSGATITLSGLQLNGLNATVETLIPLPGSAAICAGETANVPSGVTTDERGYPLQPAGGYCPSTEVDSGAVQTNYTAVNFVQQPTDTPVDMAITPSPTVEVLEKDTLLSSNNTDAVNGVPITLAYSGGSSEIATPANLAATTAGGVATFGGLVPNTTGMDFSFSVGADGDGLEVVSGTTLTQTSSLFNVYSPTPTVTTNAISAAAGTLFSGQVATFSYLTNTSSLSDFTATIDWGDGTAVSAGTVTQPGGAGAPYAVSGSHTYAAGGSYTFTVTVTPTYGTAALGTNTATVDQAPAITSANSTTFTAGTLGTFTVTASGYPVAGLSTSGTLPGGVTFKDNGNGTATLSGTPAAGTGGSYSITITASNGIGSNATQNFTLTVDQAPAIASAGSATFTTGAPGTFTVTATGYPVAGLSESGTLPSGVTFKDNGDGTATLAGTAAAGTAGSYTLTITAGNGVSPSFMQTFTLTVNAPPSFLVTTAVDDATGTPFNCAPGGQSCSLRDALAASAAVGGQITFSPTAFSASNSASQNTITLGSGGTLSIPSNTTITGLTAGASPVSLVTVDGGNTYTVFTVGSGETGTAISNLTIQHGANTGLGGGAIANSGALVLTADTFFDNQATGSGGAVGDYPGSQLNAIECTFNQNSASDSGGAIGNAGSLTVSGSTFSGNIAGSSGGGIATGNGGTLTIANSIVSGNTASNSPDDIDYASGFTDGGGNIVGYENGSAVNTAAILLSQPGNYGGPTETMIPLPGSPAICAGLASKVPAGVTTDQRGYPNSTTYGSTTCYDAGAVETNYALNFTAQQPSNVDTGTAMLPAPAVTVTESGATMTAGSETVTLTDADADLSASSTASASTTGGEASFGNLLFTNAETSDKLTATLALTPSVNVTAVSGSFAVVQLLSQTIAFNPATTSYAYSAGSFTVSATASSALAVKFASTTGGVCSVSGSTVTILAPGTCTIEATQAGNAAYAAAAPVTVNFSITQAAQTIGFTAPASPVTYGVAPIALTATGGASGNAVVFSLVSGPGAVSGSTLTVTGVGTIVVAANQAGDTDYAAAAQATQSIVVNPATLTVTADNATRAYGFANPTFTGSVTGQQYSDTFTESFATAATVASPVGTYAIVPTAKGTNLADYTQSVTDGTLTVSPAATATTLKANTGVLLPGQSVTLSAQVTSAATGTPTGSVSFYDGKSLLSTVALSAGAASYSTSSLASGVTHTLTASYSGDANFASSNSSSAATVTVAPDFGITFTSNPNITLEPGVPSIVKLAVTSLDQIIVSQLGISISLKGLPAGIQVVNTSNIELDIFHAEWDIALLETIFAKNRPAPGPFERAAPWALALLLLPLGWARRLRRQGRKLSRFLCILLVAACGFTFTTILPGCGSGTGFFDQAPQTYNVTITATSSQGVQHSVNLTVTVE